MQKIVENLKSLLYRCRSIISEGYNHNKCSGIPWLNTFCASFLQFSTKLHRFFGRELDKSLAMECREQIDVVFLCLTQVVTCIRHLERTIKAEDAERMPINLSRQHFVVRIQYCLERLHGAIHEISTFPDPDKLCLEENNYVQLMDLVLDYLSPYCAYVEGAEPANVPADNAEAVAASQQIRFTVNLVISHSLALANVALKQDKKALSALCQKVLRECIAFQDECVLVNTQNDSNRKVRAISLENALYQLEDHLNEALLRLVYTCFHDYNKFSIENLRSQIRASDPEDPAVDELIADFDVNVDRTTQVGLFAIAFASTTKMKNSVRSCLASLESLDACIIPSLYTRNVYDIHSEILEEHFDEEVATFRNAVQEIVDSHAFASCYYDMLVQSIAQAEKLYVKESMQEILDMGEALCEHFQLKCNKAELLKDDNRMQRHDKFLVIFHECRAILICSDQVESSRVLKRFKILRSMLRKFVESLKEKSGPNYLHEGDGGLPPMFLMSDDLTESQRMFESVGIAPTRHSILYAQPSLKRKRNSNKDSLRGNYSQLGVGGTSILARLLTPPSPILRPVRQVAAPQTSAVPAPVSGSAYRIASIPEYGVASGPAYRVASGPAHAMPSGTSYGAARGPAYGGSSGVASHPAYDAASCSSSGAGSGPAYGAASGSSYGAASGSSYCAASDSSYGAVSGSSSGAVSSSSYGAASGSTSDATSGPASGVASGPAYATASGLAYAAENGAAGDAAKGAASGVSIRTVDAPGPERRSIRRKHSLRTAMFKRQKSTETANAYDYYKNNSADLQISEILDQLTGLTSNFGSASLHDKSFV